MNSTIGFLAIFAIFIPFAFGATSLSQPKVSPKESDDRTLSPYFFVKSEDPEADPLPLKSTSAIVDIAGVIADVRVRQVYQNEGKRPLEAIYVFPASTRAAVYGMKMTIGKRVIHAKISRREEARREYEQAREQGKSASLLEQQRPNVFQMNVANIMPGDEIHVELSYTELLVPTDRVYEFIYPTVVGPRYSNRSAETAASSDRWIKNPYLHQGEEPHYSFDIAATVAAGLPIRELECASHKVETSFAGPAFATVRLDPSESKAGNRDFILRYRLDGDRIQSGLLLYEGEGENFFLLMMQPPRRVTNDQIPGREYVFIVDVSGSMYGFPLDISKKLISNLINQLRPTDRFNVLLFSGGSSVMSERSLPATPENIKKALKLIEQQQGGGGTELLPAFRRALSLEKAEGYSRTVVIATDGYVIVEEEVFDLIRKNLGNANVFSFGIGSAVNRHIIEGMARVGMGEPFVITRPEDAPAKAKQFQTLIQSPVLTQVKVDFQGFAAYDVEPVSVPDVLSDRPVTVFGKWSGQPGGKIILKGISGSGSYQEAIDVGRVKPVKGHSALRYLWARHRIEMLSDYNKLNPREGRVKEVTELGLAYNLLTAYTSFVAVDTETRNTEGKPVIVQQPLPLPQGVSDYALGGTASLQASAPFMARKGFAMQLKDERIPKAKKPEESDRRKVRISDIAVTDGLSKEMILKSVQKHLGEIQSCYAGGEPGMNLVLELTIQWNGRVKTVKIVSGSFKFNTTEPCIIEAAKKWTFPSFKGNREVKATVTLVIEV